MWTAELEKGFLKIQFPSSICWFRSCFSLENTALPAAGTLKCSTMLHSALIIVLIPCRRQKGRSIISPSKAIFGCWLRRTTHMNSSISPQMLRLAPTPEKKKTTTAKKNRLHFVSRKGGTSKVLSLVQSSLSLPSFPPNIEPHHVALHRPRMISNARFIDSPSLLTFYASDLLSYCEILLSELHSFIKPQSGQFLDFLYTYIYILVVMYI